MAPCCSTPQTWTEQVKSHLGLGTRKARLKAGGPRSAGRKTQTQDETITVLCARFPPIRFRLERMSYLFEFETVPDALRASGDSELLVLHGRIERLDPQQHVLETTPPVLERASSTNSRRGVRRNALRSRARESVHAVDRANTVGPKWLQAPADGARLKTCGEKKVNNDSWPKSPRGVQQSSASPSRHGMPPA